MADYMAICMRENEELRKKVEKLLAADAGSKKI